DCAPEGMDDDRLCVEGRVCVGGECRAPIDDGGACTLARECASGTCDEGICCAGPECCNVDADCPSDMVVCDDAATCQGSRGQAYCDEAHVCQIDAARVDDDQACDPSTRARACAVG